VARIEGHAADETKHTRLQVLTWFIQNFRKRVSMVHQSFSSTVSLEGARRGARDGDARHELVAGDSRRT